MSFVPSWTTQTAGVDDRSFFASTSPGLIWPSSPQTGMRRPGATRSTGSTPAARRAASRAVAAE